MTEVTERGSRRVEPIAGANRLGLEFSHAEKQRALQKRQTLADAMGHRGHLFRTLVGQMVDANNRETRGRTQKEEAKAMSERVRENLAALNQLFMAPGMFPKERRPVGKIIGTSLSQF